VSKVRNPIAYACAIVSALCLMASFGAFFLAIMPARGGDSILHTAHVLVLAAVGLGAVGLVIAKSLAGRLLNAFFGGLAGLLLLIAAMLTASDEASMKEGAAKRSQRETAAPAGPAVATYDAGALIAEWKAAPQAMDAKLGGKLVAVTGLLRGAPFFDPLGARYTIREGDSSGYFYLSSAAGTGTLVCLYRGTVTSYDGPRLHLEGCRNPS
jgi:hypothetical protein